MSDTFDDRLPDDRPGAAASSAIAEAGLLDSSSRRRPPRVAVWGHYYGPNLGDELVTSTVIAAVRRRRPEAEVIGISLAPEDTRERHGIPAYHLAPPGPGRGQRRSGMMRIVAGLRRRALSVVREIPHLWRSYWLLRGVDLIVVAGSGQLLDRWNGPWSHPYALFKWSILARLTGTKFALLSVGAGPLDGWLARRFVRRAVEGADAASVRDEHSRRVLQEAGVRRELPLCPDMAFAHDVPERESPGDGSRVVVGVNAMAHAHPDYWGRGDLSRYRAYIEKFTRVVLELLSRGVAVRLFSSHSAADQNAANDIVAAVWAAEPRLAGRLERALPTEVQQLTSFIAGCDVVIGTRYHSTVLPMLMGIPTVGVAYHPKTVDVMRMTGQSEYCIVDIDGFRAEELSRLVIRAIDDRARISADLVEGVAPLRALVERQFDVIFAPGAVPGDATGKPGARQSERGRNVA